MVSSKRVVYSSAVKQRGREKNGAAGYCPKILRPKRAKMVLCSFHRSDRKICTRNRPLSETNFLDDFWGPLPLPAPLFHCLILWVERMLHGQKAPQCSETPMFSASCAPSERNCPRCKPRSRISTKSSPILLPTLLLYSFYTWFSGFILGSWHWRKTDRVGSPPYALRTAST